MNLKAVVLASLLVTSCASVMKPPTELPTRLDSMILDHRMIWLADNLTTNEFAVLDEWIGEVLIPYVSWLEAR